MDLSKISLNVCGEKVLFVGSSIAHHCDFDALQKATGAHITTRKAYGTVWDEKMFYPKVVYTRSMTPVNDTNACRSVIDQRSMTLLNAKVSLTTGQ